VFSPLTPEAIPAPVRSAPMRDRTPERVPRDGNEFVHRASEKESFLRDVSLDSGGSSSSAAVPRRVLLEIASDKERERKARQAVRWKDLPRKGQLTVLTLARLSEPLVQTSIQVRLRRTPYSWGWHDRRKRRNAEPKAVWLADRSSRTCSTSSNG